MKRQYILPICIVFLLSVKAQEGMLQKGDDTTKDHIHITSIYHELAKSGYVSHEVYKTLGDTYYHEADYTEAVLWYSRFYGSFRNKMTSDHLFRYARTLEATGKNDRSRYIHNEFLNTVGIIDVQYRTSQENPNTPKEDSFPSPPDFLSMAMDTEGQAPPVASDFGGHPSFEMFGTREDHSDAMRSEMDFQVHETNATFSKDGTVMYFSRAADIHYLNGGPDEKIRIYRARKVGDIWTHVEDLSINGDHYSNTHPLLGLDERTLYFVSDMPSSYGKTDLYSVAIHKDGSLGEARNLGPKINTPDNELFPFISPENRLFFSTNGHNGNGGLDVFYVDLNGQDQNPKRLKGLVNGKKDDFAVIGPIRSERLPRIVVDTIKAEVERDFLRKEIIGNIVNHETGKPIKGVLVQAINGNDEVMATTETDRSGAYTIRFDRLVSHTIKVEKKGFLTKDTYFLKGSHRKRLDFQLAKKTIDLVDENGKKRRLDLTKVLNIDKELFKGNGSFLTDMAKVDLAKIATVLGQIPDMEVVVWCFHQNGPGKKNHLGPSSRERIDTVLEHLTGQGIHPSRLSSVFEEKNVQAILGRSPYPTLKKPVLEFWTKR